MDEPLVIGIPAKNEYMIGRTISDVCAALKIIKKDPVFAYGIGTNICGGRDLILKLAKENLKKDSSRMLWLDSDIWIKTPPNELARCLQDADAKNYNIIAPYRRMDNGSPVLSSISKVPGEVLVWDDVEKLEQYEKVSWAGLDNSPSASTRSASSFGEVMYTYQRMHRAIYKLNIKQTDAILIT